MEKGFNPTRKDLLLVEQLILNIKEKRAKLVTTKIGIQTSLGTLRTEYSSVTFKDPEFLKIKGERAELKRHITALELKIKAENDELSFKNKLKNEIVFHLRHNKTLEGKDDLEKVIARVDALKKKYSSFAKDRTRISSLRVMASEFIDELTSITKI